MNIHKHFIETGKHVSLYEDTILTQRLPILIYGFPASAEYTKLINSTFTVNNFTTTIYEKRNEKDVRTHIGIIIPRTYSSISLCINSAKQTFDSAYLEFLKNNHIAELPEFYTSYRILKLNENGSRSYIEFPDIPNIGTHECPW